MIYFPILIVGLIVGSLTKYIMPNKLLGIGGNMASGILGAFLGVLLVQVAHSPATSGGFASIQTLAGIGGAILAVLGANLCYELIAPDNPRGSPRI